jgi:hypothetical protein
MGARAIICALGRSLCAVDIQPFRQLDKLISDTNVVGQASEPYAFACAAHTLFLVRTELPAV